MAEINQNGLKHGIVHENPFLTLGLHNAECSGARKRADRFRLRNAFANALFCAPAAGEPYCMV